MKLDVQPMTIGDLDEVAAAESRIYPFPWTPGIFVDSLAAGYRAWVGRENGVIVAYALMMLVIDEVHLLNISVVPEKQGTGLGSSLLLYLIEDARRQKAKYMFLEVRPSNTAARAMYRRFGFGVIGERRAYYPAHSGREDAIVMSRNIENMERIKEVA